eukprot:TRINITY_DN5706_c0_g1_i1.p1 TRINITY_DN5706_c0_g1~~TRINITY_DN5706_c0_g1_i1.p1  ORF type:complete len:1580 (-),score=362.71 TRINITY_DN5706_c0_g1_i1:69-4550(-)
MGKSSAKCPLMPQGLLNIAGLFQMSCPNGVYVGPMPTQKWIVSYQIGYGGTNLDFIFPFPPTSDPVKSFSIELGWVNETKVQLVENKLTVIVMSRFTKGGILYNYGLRPNDYSTCRFSMNSTKSATGLRLVDSSNNTITGIENITPSKKSLNTSCNAALILNAKKTIQTISSTIATATNFIELTDSLWFSAWFLLSDEIQNCISYMDSRLISSSQSITYSSPQCVASPATDEWTKDPCCNPLFFSQAMQCCVSRPISTTYTNYQNISASSTEGCNSVTTSESVMQNYLILRNATTNPISGCSSTLDQYASKRLINNQYDALFSCFSMLSTRDCHEDTDCPCSTCNDNDFCNPCTIEEQQSYLLTCFNSSIPSSIESIARASWGITTVTHEEFLQSFYNRTLKPQCVTPSGSATNDTEQTCTQIGYCKSDSPNLNYNQTLKSDCPAPNNFGVCEICDDSNVCLKLPIGGYCKINDPKFKTYVDCNTITGYTYDNFVWNAALHACIVPQYDQAGCYCGTGDPNNTMCLTGYCSVGRNESECIFDPNVDEAYKYWDPILKDCVSLLQGSYVCTYYSPNQQGLWVHGKKWIEPDRSVLNITNQADCESLTVCLVNNTLVNGTCEFNTCVGANISCTPNLYNDQYACYNSSINDQYNCTTAGGWWERFDLVCIFPYEKEECLARNLTVETCFGLDQETCLACQGFDSTVCPNKAMDVLYCGLNYDQLPLDLPGEVCAEEGNGYCYDTFQLGVCYYQTSYIDNFNCPICIWDLYKKNRDEGSSPYGLELDGLMNSTAKQYIKQLPHHQNGKFNPRTLIQSRLNHGERVYVDPNIPNFIFELDTWTSNGCARVANAGSEADCISGGGIWLTQIYTKADCQGRGTRCKEPLSQFCPYKVDGTVGSIDLLTNKTQTECATCGGKSVPSYNWRAAKYQRVKRFKPFWRNESWVPVNQYIPVISQQSLEEEIVKFLYIQPGVAVANQILCSTIPIFETLLPITCDCISGQSGLSVCQGVNSSSIQLGTQLFCRGNPKEVRVGYAQFNFGLESVPYNPYCINMAIFSYSASNYRSAEVLSSSGLLSALTYKNNRYAIVTNSFKFTVGQLLSDGIGMNVTKSSFVSSVQTRALSSQTTENFTLCIDKRKDIQVYSGDFPVLDFAVTTDFKNWRPLRTNVTLVNGQYCGVVPTDTSNVFPVALTRDWDTRNSLFANNRAVQNVLYFLTAAMFLLFILSTTFTVLHFIESKLAFTLPKIILVFISIYSLLRAIFFLLFSIEKLNNLPDTNPSGYFVVAELPYYVFLSIFIFVVCFWLQITKAQKISVRKILIVILVLNIFLYTFFAVICIIRAKVTGNGVTVLNKVYKVIVATIATTIVIFAWIFGVIFMIKIFHGERLNKGSKSKKSIKLRVSIVLITTSIALLLQIIYLLYITFGSFPNISFAVANYFVVELIPAYLLFLVFFPVSLEKIKNFKTSGGTSETNSRTKGTELSDRKQSVKKFDENSN